MGQGMHDVEWEWQGSGGLGRTDGLANYECTVLA